MARIVHAGELGVDFSFARPPAARLLELGYTFVVGYISVPPAAPAKNITKAECEGYIGAGLKVLLVWEMSASRANLGAAYGTADGANARAQAAARGYPEDVPILCADDTNTTTTNIVAQEEYVRAFAAAAAPYTIGLYGDTDILGRCKGLWRIGWLPNAWAWSGATRAQAEAKAKALGAHVFQRKGFYIDDIWAVDPNEAVADFPAWGAEIVGDDVIDIVRDAETSLDKFAVMLDGTLRPLSATELRARRIVNSIDLGEPLSKEDRDILGYYTAGSGVDAVARDLIAKLNDAVGRVGQAVGDIQAGLVRAGTPG